MSKRCPRRKRLKWIEPKQRGSRTSCGRSAHRGNLFLEKEPAIHSSVAGMTSEQTAHLGHLYRQVDAKPTTTLFFYSDSVSPTSNNTYFTWRLERDFPFCISRRKRKRKWNRDTLFGKNFRSRQRIHRCNRRNRDAVGAQSKKKVVKLLSTRLFGSNIRKKCINLIKS